MYSGEFQGTFRYQFWNARIPPEWETTGMAVLAEPSANFHSSGMHRNPAGICGALIRPPASVTLVQRVGVGVNDEHALAWPVRAFSRGSGDGGSDGMWVGGGKKQRSDGAIFGNHPLPNIATIINKCIN